MKKILLAAVLLSVPLFASASSFTTGNAMEVGIGDQIGSSYDQLIFTGLTTTFSPSPAEINIGTLEFIAGPNETAPQNTAVLGSMPFSFTIDGITKMVSLDYSWTSPGNGRVDFISFLTPANLLFTNYMVDFHSIHNLNSASDRNRIETLKAKITAIEPSEPVRDVDEASSLFMIALGMFMLAYGLSGPTRAIRI